MKYITLGDIAKELQVMKDSGMSLESIQYTLNRVYWEEIEAQKELEKATKALLIAQWESA